MGKISNLTNIFQVGWNHQLADFYSNNLVMEVDVDSFENHLVAGKKMSEGFLGDTTWDSETSQEKNVPTVIG